MNFGTQPRLTRCHPERSEGSWLVGPPTPTVPAVHTYVVIFCVRLSGANCPSPTPFPAVLISPSQIAENAATLSPAFVTLTNRLKHKSFACLSYRKHPEWGISSCSVNSLNSVLRAARACSPIDPFRALRPVAASPLESTLAGHPANAHSKRLTRSVTPLYPMFTKNPGGGPQPTKPISPGCVLRGVSQEGIVPRSLTMSSCGLNQHSAKRRWKASPVRDPRYFPARRSSLGGASQSNCPLGGETRFNSSKATPAFLRDVM